MDLDRDGALLASAGESARRQRRARRGYLGAAPVDASEALAVLLGRGRTDDHGGALRLLQSQGLEDLARLAPDEMVALHGLAPAAARRLAAAFALTSCLHQRRCARRPLLLDPKAAAELLRPLFAGLEQELFVALLLDAKHRLRRVERVSLGTLTSSLVHPREVFRAAVREGAAAVLVAHNHPSGDPTPSGEDLAVTRRLHDAGRLVGIPLLDHVIVAGSRHVSLRGEYGLQTPAAGELQASPGFARSSGTRGARR